MSGWGAAGVHSIGCSLYDGGLFRIRENTVAISYRVNQNIPVARFIELLERSGLAERRPVEDRACMEGMIEHADLTVTAWAGDRLVGVARSITDFNYACYLSDLAVDVDYQRRGIGKALIAETREQLGPRCKLLLLAAPAAVEYHPKIGFTAQDNVWRWPPG